MDLSSRQVKYLDSVLLEILFLPAASYKETVTSDVVFNVVFVDVV